MGAGDDRRRLHASADQGERDRGEEDEEDLEVTTTTRTWGGGERKEEEAEADAGAGDAAVHVARADLGPSHGQPFGHLLCRGAAVSVLVRKTSLQRLRIRPDCRRHHSTTHF
eukprot:768131-Hanusia_phi.AAC.9